MIRFQIGALTCQAINDGFVGYKPQSFFCNAPEDDLRAALASYPLTKGKLLTPFHCLLVQTGAHTILIDTGLGALHPDTGCLIAGLAEAGIAPENIDIVVLSHAHGDHAGGTITAENTPVFPHAQIMLSEPEWTYWQKKRGSVRDLLAKFEPQINHIAPTNTILPGITAIPAPGHTPGQIALLLESEGERLLYVGDVIAHPLHTAHPTWNIVADTDPTQAIQTRRTVMDRAAAEAVPIYVYHCTDPGPYHVTAQGNGWQLDHA
ncbi:MAG: MBL fold metallo-hydrolase [Anaerolineae bacterium]|nr:MBL fold metallo-hydrolase [Anaerolineae bacterium]